MASDRNGGTGRPRPWPLAGKALAARTLATLDIAARAFLLRGTIGSLYGRGRPVPPLRSILGLEVGSSDGGMAVAQRL